VTGGGDINDTDGGVTNGQGGDNGRHLASNGGSGQQQTTAGQANNVCTANAPGDPAPYIFQATRGNSAKEINLHFQPGGDPYDKYLLEYGYAGQGFSFGVMIDNPKTGVFTVGELTAGQTYQFRLTPMNGCAAGSASNVFPVGVGLVRVPGVPNTGYERK
jgi:hypothetical protein